MKPLRNPCETPDRYPDLSHTNQFIPKPIQGGSRPAEHRVSRRIDAAPTEPPHCAVLPAHLPTTTEFEATTPSGIHNTHLDTANDGNGFIDFVGMTSGAQSITRFAIDRETGCRRQADFMAKGATRRLFSFPRLAHKLGASRMIAAVYLVMTVGTGLTQHEPRDAPRARCRVRPLVCLARLAEAQSKA